MALLDLSQVTRTLITLLEQRLPTYPDWPAAATLLASPGAPDTVNGPHALSLYLYHMREEAHTKAQDWQVNDQVPQRFKPMGLALYYMLCPRSNVSDLAQRAYVDQLLMGLAMKTLRDLPVIDDTTTVDGLGGATLVMPLAIRGRGNRLRVLLQPTAPEEASQYWQAGSQPMRLAAYYEVSATLLEPDVIRGRQTRVLSVGVHGFVRGAPRIEGTRNRINYTLPGEVDPREIRLCPAEVSFGQPFEVFGADLIGDSTALLLVHGDFADPVEVDATWSLTTDGQMMGVVARATAGPQAILPGIYGLLVRTVARRTLPDGSSRDFETYSNQGTLAIAPRILSVTVAGSLLTLQVDGFEPHTLANGDISLFVGPDRLARTATNPPPTGSFFTPGPPPLPAPPAPQVHQVRFRFPTGIPAGTVLPLRLIVRGVESAPRWESAP